MSQERDKHLVFSESDPVEVNKVLKSINESYDSILLKTENFVGETCYYCVFCNRVYSKECKYNNSHMIKHHGSIHPKVLFKWRKELLTNGCGWIRVSPLSSQ